MNVRDGRNTFQTILEECNSQHLRGDSATEQHADAAQEENGDAHVNNTNVYLQSDKHLRANNLNVDPTHKKCIMDGGADTSMIGQGWTVVAETNRKVNVIGFD